MRNKRLQAAFSVVLLVLIISVSAGLVISNSIVVLANGLDEAFNIVGESLRLKYEYTYIIKVSNIGNAPVVLNVSEYYMYIIINLNSTHVKVISSPTGNVTVKFTSGSWIALAALLSWAGSNVTEFLRKFVIPSINGAILPKSKLNDVLKAVATVSPVLLRISPKSCNQVSVDEALFDARRYDVGVSGVAYYECRTGILLKYINGSVSTINMGSKSIRIYTELHVKLVAANTDLLREIIIGRVPASTTTPATHSVLGEVPSILLVLSVILAVVMGLMYFRIRRTYQK